jgi:hypothetical protein
MFHITFWYYWLTIQNTANGHVSNAFGLLGIFISFSGGTQSMAVRPRTAGSSDQLCALPFLVNPPFDGGKKIEKKRKKKRKSCPKGPDRFSAAAACGWAVFELPLLRGRCHRASTGLHRGVLHPRRTAER